MPKLPSLTARKVIRALKRVGFVEDRQRGSHLVLIQPETKARTVVPVHLGRTIKESLATGNYTRRESHGRGFHQAALTMLVE